MIAGPPREWNGVNQAGERHFNPSALVVQLRRPSRQCFPSGLVALDLREFLVEARDGNTESDSRKLDVTATISHVRPLS